MALVWFLQQAVTVGGLGAIYVVAPLAVCVVFLVVAFPRKDPAARRRLTAFLVALPVIWILIGLWGQLFWCDWQHTTNQCGPQWKQFGPDVGIVLFLVTAVAFVWRARGARRFAVAYTMVNAYFVLAMSVLSSMAVTGVWL
ncbi:MAG TPA: hypothetical protein VK807_08845 [Gemmatimonadaceae bacterium]|nr:hypothetical protein [Gemmatimonadaceae bacterium]